MNLWHLAPALVGAALLLPRSPAPPATQATPCTFGRANPIPAASTLADQFKCYQTSRRHVTLVGSRTFEEGRVSGGICVLGVAPDRVQLAACGSFAGDSALTLPYPAIAYVVDDPRAGAVGIYLTALFHR